MSDEETQAGLAGSWFADPNQLLASLRAGGPAKSGDDSHRLPAIAGYELLHEIARGGQGIVYLATQRSTRRRVALKLLIERGFAAAAARRRFEREVELLASIDHPCIVKVFDSGVTEDGLLFLVMEFVDGTPLDRHLGSASGGSSAAIPAVIELIAQVAEAVHAAHRRGVIHRDLKPSNILVTPDGTPRIVDFGLARALERSPAESVVSVTGQFVGSLPWASPEHAAGTPDRIDIRSDVYSLGVVLFQALTGEFPYPVDGSLAATLRAIAEAAPGRPSARRAGISRDIDAIVLTCLAKAPEQRYASALDLAEDLRAVAHGAPIRARRESAWDGMSRTLRRYRLITAVSLAASFLVLIFAGVAWRSSNRAEAERARAERRFEEARELARSFLFEFHEAVLPLAGSRPARERIVTTALAYLKGLEAEVGDDPSFRSDLAAAYERVADMQGNPTFPNLGQTAGAIESLRASVALREANLRDAPNDADSLRLVGRALNLIGLIQWQSGASDAAIATLAEADGHLSRARAIEPTNALLLREIAANRDRASTLADMHGDQARSLALIDEGIAALDAVADRAAVRDALDVLLYKRAFSLRRAGRLEESLATSERSVALNRELIAEAPDDASRRRSLSVSLNELATTQMALDRLDDAGRTLDESIAIARALREADRTSPSTIFDLAYSLAKAAQLERQRGATDAAIDRFLEVHALRAEASALDPTNAVIRRGAAIALGMAAETAEAAAGDAGAPTDRRAAHARRAIDLYRASGDLLRAMERDGVLLKGDDAIIASFEEAIGRLNALVDAIGRG